MEISNYVGCIIVEYNNGLNNQQGTFFLINDTTIVTASHVVDNKESIKTIQLTFNGGFCSSFSYKKEFAIKSVDEISVIEFFVPIQYVPLGRRPEYNVYFSVNGFQSLSWESVGFCKNGVNPKQLHICGDKCDKIESTNGKDTFILSGIQIPWTSYEGMSGSPVLVNGLIVGILDAQDVIDGVGKNLRFTSIKKIEDRLPPEAISRVIYNNKKFAKQNYAEDFAFDNYVHRTVSYYNEAGERQFTTLLDSVLYGNQNNIVLLGDAGIGKTVLARKK